MATGLVNHFVAMAGNNAWSNHRLLSACKTLTPAEFTEKRTGFFPSLRATLNHILWVDIYYIDALHRDPTVLKRYDDPPPDFPDAHQLYEAQRKSDRRLVDFCERQTDASLAEGALQKSVGADMLVTSLRAAIDAAMPAAIPDRSDAAVPTSVS